MTSPQLAEEAQRDEDVAKADVLVAESDIEKVSGAGYIRRAIPIQLREGYDQHALVAPFEALVIERHKELGTVVKAAIRSSPSCGSVWALAYVDSRAQAR